MSPYRYRLSRTLNTDHNGAPATVLFVMLNPSTATETQDDPTIGRCMGFARAWGYDRLEVANLFAWRATNPRHLTRVDDPIGEGNNSAIVAAARDAALIVCAWGGSVNRRRLLTSRAAEVRDLLRGQVLYALEITSCGQPRHPLYLRADVRPRVWVDALGGIRALRARPLDPPVGGHARHAVGCNCSLACEMRAFRSRASARRELHP